MMNIVWRARRQVAQLLAAVALWTGVAPMAAAGPGPWQAAGQAWNVSLRGADGQASPPAVQVDADTAQAGAISALTLTVVNSSTSRQLLEIRLTAKITLDPATAIFWDGSAEARKPAPGLNDDPFYREPRNVTPLAAVGDAGQAVLISLSPQTIKSYFRKFLTFDPSGPSTLAYDVRLVLEPGQKETVQWVAGSPAGANFDLMRACWQMFQDAFPTHFQVQGGVAHNVWMTSTQYRAWWQAPQRTREPYRRARAGWEWCYAPFRRCGDMIGRPDEWDYTPLSLPLAESKPALFGAARPMSQYTLESFQQARRDYFAQYGYDTGSLFYTPAGVWVEKQLAREKFSDAIVVNPDLSTEKSRWVTRHDAEVLVQPDGTSYEARLYEDYRWIAENLEVIGFAFDVFYPSQRNYSPVVLDQPLTGRGYDDKGVFYDLGLSMIRQSQYVRSLPTPNRPFQRLAVVAGSMGYLNWFDDAALMELTLYGARRKEYEHLRLCRGSKPGVIWKGWDMTNVMPQWKKATRSEFLQTFARLSDYVHLKSFEWGIYPGYNYVPGVDKIQQTMPLLQELVKAGWQPLLPVTIQSPPQTVLWPSRYGRGPSHYLACGNPQEQALSATFAVDARHLAGWTPVYVDRRQPQQTVTQTLDETGTTFQAQLPSREVSVWQSVCGFRGPIRGQAVAAAYRSLDGLAATLELNLSQPADVEFLPATIAGFTLASLTVDGRTVEDSVFKGALAAGVRRFEWTYRSDRFAFSDEALRDFGFVDDGNQWTVSVIAPAPQTRAHSRAASMIQRYFQFYRSSGRTSAVGPIPLVTDRAAARTPRTIHMRLDPKVARGRWTLEQDGADLVLTAPDEAQAIELTLALLDALDRHYPKPLPFESVVGLSANVLNQFKLQGKMLSAALNEEGLGQ